jgi:hypothetical protein
MDADTLAAALGAASGDGERVAILATYVVEMAREQETQRREQETQRGELDTLTANASESRVERTRHKDALANLADMMLALGERVGKVERGQASLTRHFEALEETHRLRHAEIMHALGVAARDTTARGTALATTAERVAVAESSLVRVTKMVGLSGTALAALHLILNFLSTHVIWRAERYARDATRSGPAVAASPSSSGSPGGPGAGHPVAGQRHPDP